MIKNSYIRLAQATEQNTHVFTEAFQMADAQIHVMQRALNDFVLGKVYKTEEGGIDYSRYLIEYWSCMSFSAFVAGLRNASQQHLPEPVPVDQDVTVFGGS